MSASILTPFEIVIGPTVSQLWNAAQHQHSLYFKVRPAGSHVDPSRKGIMRRRGVPLAVAAEYGQPNALGIRFYDYEYNVTLTGQYSIDATTGRKSGTLSCDAAQARIEWLGLCFDIVEPLAERGIHTVGDALNHSEVSVCQALLEDLMGYGMNNAAAQRAVGRFCRLRERLQMLNPELQFHGGTHREDDLFMIAF